MERLLLDANLSIFEGLYRIVGELKNVINY